MSTWRDGRFFTVSINVAKEVFPFHSATSSLRVSERPGTDPLVKPLMLHAEAMVSIYQFITFSSVSLMPVYLLSPCFINLPKAMMLNLPPEEVQWLLLVHQSELVFKAYCDLESSPFSNLLFYYSFPCFSMQTTVAFGQRTFFVILKCPKNYRIFSHTETIYSMPGEPSRQHDNGYVHKFWR